jgi:hypothetical protein
MTQEVKPQDHPDFIGGWVWTELESRWIEKRIAEAILAEREACAQTCENLPIPNQFSESEGSIWDVAALDCAEAIRARGQA